MSAASNTGFFLVGGVFDHYWFYSFEAQKLEFFLKMLQFFPEPLSFYFQKTGVLIF